MKRIGVLLVLAVLLIGRGGFAGGGEDTAQGETDRLAESLKTAVGVERQVAIGDLIESGEACLPTVNAILLERDEELSKRIAGLIDGLGHGNWEVREGAHKELVSIGLRALAQVTEGMDHDDREIAYRCSQIKIKIEEGGVGEVIERRRQFTGLLFVAKAFADGSSLEALHKCCDDSERDVRVAAADAVATLASESSLGVLTGLLDDECLAVRLLAGGGITRISSDEARAATLEILLDVDENVHLRRLAAIALGGSGERKMIGGLIRVMNDNSYAVRHSAFEGIMALSGLVRETFGFDYRGGSAEAVAARAAAIEKWEEWWGKESGGSE